MRALVGIVAGASLLCACQQKPAEPVLEKAWARLPAVAGRPGAAYFTLTGGRQADKVVQISSSAAGRAELHETVKQDGVNAMRPLGELALGVNESVVFAPGGKHVMLFDLAPTVKPGDRIPLVVTFASGKRVEAPAQVVGAGDPQP
ncbi:copper chaperone PCu(A)C [Sphingomonas sp. S2-65]|uniref:copper chaperone PCu(A)C n=1 Tax=Sphingomonas sp. S2-65 TaxID=2903960 RepID=UPI001F3D0FCF|nr:copper chaperone PCu(A)C [Sphingomonas sp. S2-65]UYY59924.1 copper chaperone PCu(A)C [Sphingomonas sp. S2-65]